MTKNENAFLDAVEKGDLQGIKTALQLGVDINIQEETTAQSALMIAISNRHPKVVQYLIDAKINLDLKDDDGNTAFIWAAYRGDKEACIALIEAGADIDATDSEDLTGFRWACHQEFHDVVKIIIQAKVKSNISLKGDSDYQWAKQNHIKVVIDLFEQTVALFEQAELNTFNQHEEQDLNTL